jgi:hypothetical protein
VGSRAYPPPAGSGPLKRRALVGSAIDERLFLMHARRRRSGGRSLLHRDQRPAEYVVPATCVLRVPVRVLQHHARGVGQRGPVRHRRWRPTSRMGDFGALLCLFGLPDSPLAQVRVVWPDPVTPELRAAILGRAAAVFQKLGVDEAAQGHPLSRLDVVAAASLETTTLLDLARNGARRSALVVANANNRSHRTIALIERHKGQGCGAGAQDFPPAESIDGPASPAADCSSKPLRGSRSALSGAPFAEWSRLHFPAAKGAHHARDLDHAAARAHAPGVATRPLSERTREAYLRAGRQMGFHVREPTDRGHGPWQAARDQPARCEVPIVMVFPRICSPIDPSRDGEALPKRARVRARARSGRRQAHAPGSLNIGLQGRLRGLQSIFC